jgi:hypothetical protein
MVWAKAADHHGASGIAFSSATRVIIFTQKVSWKYGTFLQVEDKKMGVAKPFLNSYIFYGVFFTARPKQHHTSKFQKQHQ